MDTSVLVAGIAGFRGRTGSASTRSATLLRRWIEHGHFTWLVTEAILDEYREVLARCGVRRSLIGRIVNLLREEAMLVEPRRSIDAAPDPDDAPFWECADAGAADFIVTLNARDFPQARLAAKVILPGESLPTGRTPRRRRRARERR